MLGANISNLTLNQLQSISGSLAITFKDTHTLGTINLSGVTSFLDAAGSDKGSAQFAICRSRP